MKTIKELEKLIKRETDDKKKQQLIGEWQRAKLDCSIDRVLKESNFA